MKQYYFQFSLLLLSLKCFAGPATISPYLHVDQFGYRPSAQKVCIISDPQVGFNGAESFAPGSTYEIKRWSDDVTVFSAAITAWNGGATHAQSGDKVWWFDFSSVTTPSDYYVYDPTNDVGSYKFSIDDDAYNDVMEQSLRMFYLQRCGTPKTATNAGAWQDLVCHTHALQDLNCRSVSQPNNGSTEKDLSGGWHDAGDFNKYVNFTWAPVHSLLFAYQENPMVFDDNNNIPESGNGIPDMLDELKWELDWLLKMQLADGSVLMKVGVPCYESASPASADLTQRLYGPAQASATRAVASMFAHAAVVYGSLGDPAMNAYAATLLQKAELAWTWIVANPATSSYNNSGFCSINPEWDVDTQNEARTGAAAMLFAATGNTTYRSYFDNNYTSIRPYSWTYWYPFQPIIQDMMLYYASLSNATNTVANNIKNNCITSVNTNNVDLLTAWNNNTDAYRAYLKNDDYVWGSNQVKANAGTIFYNMLVYNLSPANATAYRNAAESFIHFLHGANPINKAMLTNMGDYGAEGSCDEMYHAWFGDGTDYDNAQTSPIGPPSGYMTGGFNKNFAPDPACNCVISPPQNQPVQKSYKDWNTSWPENSWELTEPAIYTQAAYIKLLSKFASETMPLSVEMVSFNAAVYQYKQALLTWSVATWDNIYGWDIERSNDGQYFTKIGTVAIGKANGQSESFKFLDHSPNIGTNYYRLKILELDGRFTYSAIKLVNIEMSLSIEIYPNPTDGELHVHIVSQYATSPILFRLYDAQGRVVNEQTVEVTDSDMEHIVVTEGLLSGVYFLEGRNGQQVFHEKLMVK
ncbi:MAG: glycoside hydrolase family 9 protein [Saprospiraceae bacterium]|nr:glycoside hydrolase family 9 protein [Saprospiraceae bacterium]MCF8250600.1 glycoside hydrolase family 9 protein [Saprospiraceae bacterium]MCF8281416.1 glycoside hydrolase family 9 protein [Bacteroidales bacterium]MCF8313081.1 glycoside hydrolase family 9 protein [Saprospiraceae bacterium]MCF8441555.1 glycoside hydrolase family 9 protein [Saprospiraceae bacterium]